MVVRFTTAGEPDPRPPVCPRCGRGPEDYPPGTVRAVVVPRPAEADDQTERTGEHSPAEPAAPPALPYDLKELPPGADPDDYEWVEDDDDGMAQEAARGEGGPARAGAAETGGPGAAD
jgi:hypothetical protein